MSYINSTSIKNEKIKWMYLGKSYSNFSKPKTRESLESSKREVVHFYKVSSMKLIVDFLSENMEARDNRIFFNKKEKKNCYPRILYSVKLSLVLEWRRNENIPRQTKVERVSLIVNLLYMKC